MEYTSSHWYHNLQWLASEHPTILYFIFPSVSYRFEMRPLTLTKNWRLKVFLEQGAGENT